MNPLQYGPWLMGIIAFAGMTLLPAASAAELCLELGCLMMYLFWIAGIAVVCAILAVFTFYRAAAERAAPAALSLLVMTWAACYLATGLYLAEATDVSIAYGRYLGMITVGSAVVVALGFWGGFAVRRGGGHFAAFLGAGMLICLFPAGMTFAAFF